MAFRFAFFVACSSFILQLTFESVKLQNNYFLILVHFIHKIMKNNNIKNKLIIHMYIYLWGITYNKSLVSKYLRILYFSVYSYQSKQNADWCSDTCRSPSNHISVENHSKNTMVFKVLMMPLNYRRSLINTAENRIWNY